MLYLLISILLITFLLPIISKKVEENLELFLFFAGALAVIVSGNLNKEFFITIFQNKFMYAIAAAVLIGGFLFKELTDHINIVLTNVLKYIPLKLFVFLIIVVLGILSSVITAIIASLFLVEIISILPISRKNKININIISCFSIGLGAVLTPIGEPLAIILVSKLNADFWFLSNEFSIYIIPGILILGVLGILFAKEEKIQEEKSEEVVFKETNKTIVVRALKILLFVIALDLLGEGFKPIIDTYIIGLDTRYLYWANMCSAVLDNATLAAAEVSVKMSELQIKAVLMGLLISGGMMIPGNIPNIISAGKLKIKSSEWMKLGIPTGLLIMIIYFLILFAA